jgi:benzoyl-CoA reductase subunit C
MSDTTTRCEQLITDVDFQSVAAWKGAHPGAKAIGYFPVYAPTEIIHAFGALPVAIHGAGDRLDIQHADARFGSFICSICKTTLELGLTERLRHFDGILFTSICDTARNLCFVLKRNFPDLYVDFIHLPHNCPSDAAVEFLTADYDRLRWELGKLTGRRADDDALRHSIAVYNTNRQLTDELYALRSRLPHIVSTFDLYVLVRAGDFLPVEEHNEMLRKALTEFASQSRRPRDCIRVVIEGSFCEQPPLDLIRLIESAGCYIVEDDFTLGRRWFRHQVPTTGEPLRALAESYVNDSVYSSVRHDGERSRVDGLIEKVRLNRADAVLSFIAKFCEPAYFDYVLFKRELEHQGIPHLLLEFEEKLFTFDRLQMEIETFVESLLFV